jgi:hypothetical protein
MKRILFVGSFFSCPQVALSLVDTAAEEDGFCGPDL